MLNYTKIESYRKDKKISQEVLALKCGFKTREGYGQMLRNRSMKVETLEKIAEFLNIPIWEFFDEGKSKGLMNLSSEPGIQYQNKHEEIIDTLKEQLKMKDDQIKFLQHLIEEKS